MLIYAGTIFIGAFLLFQIQPMIAKMILPWFGGSAAVWITSMLFFQTWLLAGYIYAHVVVRYLKPKVQIMTHAGLLCASLLLLPIVPAASWKRIGSEAPILRILGLLTVSVGLPYFLLSTTSPLLQAWYSRKYTRHPNQFHRTQLSQRTFEARRPQCRRFGARWPWRPGAGGHRPSDQRENPLLDQGPQHLDRHRDLGLPAGAHQAQSVAQPSAAPDRLAPDGMLPSPRALLSRP